MVNILKHFLRKILLKGTTLEQVYGEKLQKKYVANQETIPTPETKDMVFTSPAQELIRGETYTTPEIYTTVIEDVIYSPKGNFLLTKSRQIILDSILIGCDLPGIGIKHLFLSPVETISGTCAIFRSNYYGYYHTLLDESPRINLLNQPEYADFPEISLLCPGGSENEWEQFFLSKLAPKNIKITPVSTDNLYYIEKLIFPSFVTKRCCGYLPSVYLKNLASKVLPERPRNKQNRIFISRRKSMAATKELRGRHILNESELLESLKPLGFESYELEDLSISETIDLFYDAQIVIGAHGGGLANLMFSEKVSVLELHPLKIISSHYYYLCKSMGHQYRFWCDNVESTHSLVNFEVDIAEVLAIVNDFNNN